ncbi:MAG: ACP S-malonyltransferase [Saprospiraceae bacterium]|nr:ACP S-malonyltransferase [Saprospiraceae bacterium]
MKTAYIFPGQGAQFEGMGLDLFERSEKARRVFETADEILGFELSKIMFYGTSEELKQTKVTQPALFVHSIASLEGSESTILPEATAGHSLGEFSALVCNKTISFEDGLRLVSKRALAMQKACEAVPGTMAAILGLEDSVVEKICADISEVVVAANYNCPGQLVISGSTEGIQCAITQLTEAGAKRALLLEVGGAFHSPLMEPAREELETAIRNTIFHTPVCPVYQNINALPETDPIQIQNNLIAQLTGAVRWTQIVENMLSNGIERFVEVGGNGKVLSGLVKKVNRMALTEAL